MGLTTLTAVKTQGNITDTSRDNQLQYLITGLSAWLKRTLHRNIESLTQTEYYSGNNTTILQLRQYPIISVSRVCIDSGGNFGQAANAFPSSLDLIAGQDYAIMSGQNGLGSSGQLRRINSVWWQYPVWAPGKVAPQLSEPTGSILVTYTSGFVTIPADLQYAINYEILIASKRMGDVGDVSSESYQGASQSYFSPEQLQKILGSVNQVLGCHRSFAV